MRILAALILGGYRLHRLQARHQWRKGVIALASILAFSSCKKEDGAGPASGRQPNPKNQSFGYFKTHFQDESQFIVETVLTDLAEMAYFAKNAGLPDPGVFSVQARQARGTQFRAPVYGVEIVLQPSQPPLKTEIKVSGPIWSPEVYSQFTEQLFSYVGLTPHKADGIGENTVDTVVALQDASAATSRGRMAPSRVDCKVTFKIQSYIPRRRCFWAHLRCGNVPRSSTMSVCRSAAWQPI